jgi:hypothetical protein
MELTSNLNLPFWITSIGRRFHYSSFPAFFPASYVFARLRTHVPLRLCERYSLSIALMLTVGCGGIVRHRQRASLFFFCSRGGKKIVRVVYPLLMTFSGRSRRILRAGHCWLLPSSFPFLRCCRTLSQTRYSCRLKQWLALLTLNAFQVLEDH